MLLFPELEPPIYIKGSSRLQTYLKVSGNVRKLAINNYGETTREGVKIIAVPSTFVTKFRLIQYALEATKRKGSRAGAGTKKPYSPSKPDIDEN